MAGVGTNLDVIDAQVALTEAKTNFVNACMITILRKLHWKLRWVYL